MKRFTAFLLALSLLLGGAAYAAGEGTDFIPATGEDPSANPPAPVTSEATPTTAPVQPASYVSAAVDPASVTYPIECEPEEYVVRAGLFYGSTALVHRCRIHRSGEDNDLLRPQHVRQGQHLLRFDGTVRCDVDRRIPCPDARLLPDIPGGACRRRHIRIRVPGIHKR